MWMMNQKVISGQFSIYLNNERVEPYKLDDQDGVDKMAEWKKPVVQ
jgi:hypothetical protein